MPSSKIRSTTIAASVLALAALLSGCRGGSAAPDKDWDRRVKDVQQRGAPLVRAIYKFQASCGLWPYTLDELAPDYAGPQQVKGWDYTWHAGGWWQLNSFGAFPDALLCYKHVSADKAGWIATDGDSEAWLKGGEIEPPAVDVTDKERDAACVAVLRARIARYNNEIIHHQGLICWYYRQGEYQSACEACEQCLKRWPGHWWPNLMMSYIEQKRNRTEDADKWLARFADEHDDLTRWYLVGEFYADTGRMDKAREALAKAARMPLAHLCGEKDSGEILARSGGEFAWLASALCYRQGWLPEALGVCDQWERFRQKQGYGGQSYLAIRAACWLAQGKEEEARVTLEPLMEAAKKSQPAAEHLEELAEAINRKNRDFHYDPGDSQFSVFIEYK